MSTIQSEPEIVLSPAEPQDPNREIYARCLSAEGRGEKPDADDAKQLAKALAALGKSREDYRAEVAVLREYHATMKQVARREAVYKEATDKLDGFNAARAELKQHLKELDEAEQKVRRELSLQLRDYPTQTDAEGKLQSYFKRYPDLAMSIR